MSLDTVVQTVQLSRDRLRKNASLRPSLLRQCRDICGTPGTAQLAGSLTAESGVVSNGRARQCQCCVLRASLEKVCLVERCCSAHGLVQSAARRGGSALRQVAMTSSPSLALGQLIEAAAVRLHCPNGRERLALLRHR